MGFLQDLLNDDEDLLAQMRPHPALLAAPVTLLAVAIAAAVAIAVHFSSAPIAVAWVLVAMVALPALWTCGRALQWRAVRFVVTSSRLIYRRGVLGHDVVQLRLQRVAEVHLRQTLRGRVIGYGQLVFEVVGGDGPLVVDDVRRPRSLVRLITAQLDRLDVPRRGIASFAPGANGTAVTTGGGSAPTGQWGAAQWETAPAARAPRRRLWSDTPAHGVPVGALAAAPGSVPDQLFALDELRRRGIVNDAEFAAKKAELLSRL
ncbi:MAG: PH domain-containing protein [Acidimicrobiales bacterium]